VGDKIFADVCLRSRYFLARHTHHAGQNLHWRSGQQKNNVDKAFKWRKIRNWSKIYIWFWYILFADDDKKILCSKM